MSVDNIFDTYENNFFELKEKKVQTVDESLPEHEVFNMKTPEPTAKGKYVIPQLETNTDGYEKERIYWMGRIEDLTNSLKSQVGSDDTLSSIPNVYTAIVERYHAYATMFARKNAAYRIEYAKMQEKILNGDRKISKGNLDSRVDAILAFEKMDLEFMQTHMGFIDEMRETVKNIFYLVKHYERFRDNLSNTNIK